MTNSQNDTLVEYWQYLASTPDDKRDVTRRVEATRAVLAVCTEYANRRIRGARETRGKDAEDIAAEAFMVIWRRMNESATGCGKPLLQDSVGAIRVYVSRCVGNAMRPSSKHVGVNAFLLRSPESELSHLHEPGPGPEDLVELALQVQHLQRLLLAEPDNEPLWRWFHYALRIKTGGITWQAVVAKERADVRGDDIDKDRDWFDANLRRRRNRIFERLDEMSQVSSEVRTLMVNLVDHVMRLREAPNEQEG